MVVEKCDGISGEIFCIPPARLNYVTETVRCCVGQDEVHAIGAGVRLMHKPIIAGFILTIEHLLGLFGHVGEVIPRRLACIFGIALVECAVARSKLVDTTIHEIFLALAACWRRGVEDVDLVDEARSRRAAMQFLPARDDASDFGLFLLVRSELRLFLFAVLLLVIIVFVVILLVVVFFGVGLLFIGRELRPLLGVVFVFVVIIILLGLP